MNSYERKQEAKRARLEAAADRAAARAAAAYKRADLREEASGIPFGQPILVGHHSERRHRKAIERADNAMRTSIDESKRAGDLRARAASVGTGGISSDDPDAPEKLAAKIEKAELLQAFMRAANKVIRRWVKKLPEGQDNAGFEDYFSALRAIRPDMTVTLAAELLKPDFAGRAGFAAYQLQNNGANIKRMKARLAQIERTRGGDSVRQSYQGLCEVVENVEENRIQVIFDGKPDANVRADLKANGFRWAPSQGAWQRHLTNAGRYALKRFLQSQGIGG